MQEVQASTCIASKRCCFWSFLKSPGVSVMNGIQRAWYCHTPDREAGFNDTALACLPSEHRGPPDSRTCAQTMPAGARYPAAVEHAHNQQLRHITDLPQSMLELIFISSTCTEEKKALRQTCKHFQQLLDNNLVRLKLEINGDEHVQRLQRFLAHKQHIHSFQASVRPENQFNSSISNRILSELLEILPEQLTTLKLFGPSLRLKDVVTDLGRLSRLKSLYINVFGGECEGLQHITGLTYLQCYWPVGSVAHLAPTLRQLHTNRYENVQDMDQLTNLEVLTLGNLPINFFQSHGHLPLKHLQFSPSYGNRTDLWVSAPTTLTRITLPCAGDRPIPEVLPSSITHLQLLYPDCKCVQQVATAVPRLQKPDISTSGFQLSQAPSTFEHLKLLTNLQSLGLSVSEDGGVWSREKLITHVRCLREAVERGVRLTVIARYQDFVEGPFQSGSPWATCV